MKKSHIAPLLGLAASSLLSFAIMRFWLIDVYVEYTGLSREAATAYLLVLLGIVAVVRVRMIFSDNDLLAKWIGRLFKR